MSETYSDAFKAQFSEMYGRYGKTPPDFTKCAKAVHSGDAWSGAHQCSRKNGHGPEGAWCKQHDPVARKAKEQERMEKLRSDIKREADIRKLKTERLDIIKQISEGHNDPRALCQDYLYRWAAIIGGEG